MLMLYDVLMETGNTMPEIELLKDIILHITKLVF
jgi:hypothetical protein